MGRIGYESSTINCNFINAGARLDLECLLCNVIVLGKFLDYQRRSHHYRLHDTRVPIVPRKNNIVLIVDLIL